MVPSSSSVVNCVAYAGGRRVGVIELDDISEVVKQEDCFIWIGLQEPDEALLRKVQEEFGLHELAIEDALRAHQRPKLERYGDSLFIVLRTVELQAASKELHFGETHLFVGPRYLVSVRHGSSVSHIELRARCEANTALLAQGPGFVLYALMDFIVDRYFPVVDWLEGELEAVEEKVFEEAFDRSTTGRIYDLKRMLMEVKRAVSPLVDVCNQLTRFDTQVVSDLTRPYFRDVYDHVVRINEMIDMQREMLTAALEANLSMVTVAQNEITKKLAAWAAIIAVPTMIAGIYGMNFQHMPELRWTFGYPAVMVVLIGLCGFLYWRFKQSRWL